MLPVLAHSLPDDVTRAAPLDARAALGRVPFLALVPAATLDRLAARAVLHGMPAAAMLFEQAEVPTFAQILAEGSVELLGVRGEADFLIELVSAPDILLPAAVINRQPYLMRARVLTPARLVLIQADAFRAAVAADHALCLAVLACQAAQFRRQVRLAKNVRLRSAEERAGCYVRALLGAAPPGRPVRLPVEKRLIASQLGMTRETFSRALSAMPAYGMRVQGETVTLEDPGAADRLPMDALIDGSETIDPLPINKDFV